MIKSFYHFWGYKAFIKGYYRLLCNTLSEFLSAEVKLLYDPVSDAQKLFGIDIIVNPRREVYLFPEKNEVLIIVSIPYRGESFLLGIILSGNMITEHKKIFNSIAKGVASILSDTDFQKSFHELDDTLIAEILSQQVARGYYNLERFKYLIRYFRRLSTTTFEGQFFSTGLIVTKARHDYFDKRNGQLMSLTKQINVFDPIDHRVWYLNDGKSSFYLFSPKTSFIKDMFVYNDLVDYLPNRLLSWTLLGGDVVFRVERGRLFSIIDSRGMEYMYQGNVWRLRNYNLLQSIIDSKAPLSSKVYKSLLSIVLECSQSGISTIIWLPTDDKKIDDVVKKDTKNRITRESINISESKYYHLIMRLLSSDGASIISTSGDLLWNGCIVDNSKIAVKGSKGTGETAAKELAKNGVAIKVSQDGTIKVFVNGRNSPLKI